MFSGSVLNGKNQCLFARGFRVLYRGPLRSKHIAHTDGGLTKKLYPLMGCSPPVSGSRDQLDGDDQPPSGSSPSGGDPSNPSGSTSPSKMPSTPSSTPSGSHDTSASQRMAGESSPCTDALGSIASDESGDTPSVDPDLFQRSEYTKVRIFRFLLGRIGLNEKLVF